MKYTVSYVVETPTEAELINLLSEIESDTGLIAIKIEDETGQEISLE